MLRKGPAGLRIGFKIRILEVGKREVPAKMGSDGISLPRERGSSGGEFWQNRR